MHDKEKNRANHELFFWYYQFYSPRDLEIHACRKFYLCIIRRYKLNELMSINLCYIGNSERV